MMNCRRSKKGDSFGKVFYFLGVSFFESYSIVNHLNIRRYAALLIRSIL